MSQGWNQKETMRPSGLPDRRSAPDSDALLESGTVPIDAPRLVLDCLLPDFPERYHAARDAGTRVLINPFDIVYRLGWDPDQAFLLEVLDDACDEINLAELRDDDGVDLLGRYLLDAVYGAARRGGNSKGKGVVLESTTLEWFVLRGCSLQTLYTQRQVAGYQDKLIGQVFQSNNDGRSALSLIQSSEASVVPSEHPWLQSLRASSTLRSS